MENAAGREALTAVTAYGYAEAAVRVKLKDLPVKNLSLASSELLKDGETVNLVNPAYETAISLRELLKEEGIDNQGHNKTEENPYEFFVSDAAERFKAFANSILPFDITTTRQIQIEEF